MSWLFGYLGNRTNLIQEKIKPLRINTSVEYSFTLNNKTLFLTFSKESPTCIYNINNEDLNGWIVCGVGLKKTLQQFTIMNKSDWNDVISLATEDLNHLNGHFTVIKWTTDSVKVFTDRLGLRDMYFAKGLNGLCFSTRSDWLSKTLGKTINFSEFGSRWLLINQMSNKSIFNNISRLSSGRTLSITNNNDEFMSEEPLNSQNNFGLQPDNFFEILKEIIRAPINSNHDLSLFLSGGLDSRLIISVLKTLKDFKLNTYTLGDVRETDSVIAKRVANTLNINHVQIEDWNSEKKIDDNDLTEFVANSLLNNPVSAFMRLSSFSSNHFFTKNTIFIDGGFGEIWRREFLNKLLVYGKSAVKQKEATKIINYLKYNRADIFNKEVLDDMLAGCLNQINKLIEECSKFEQIENILDNIALKTRLPNYYGQEQSRIDNYFISYMPLAQYELIKHLFEMPINQRRNGKLFKKIIKSSEPKLAHINLAKGNFTNPFFLSTMQSRIYSKIKSKFYTKETDIKRRIFLQRHCEKSLDLVHSQEFRNIEYYDHSSINRIVTSFCKNDFSYINQFDWWLTFDLFRNHINKN